MGNCVSRRQEQALVFDSLEMKQLNMINKQQIERYPACRKNNGLNLESFKEIFSENIVFAEKFFNFIQQYGKHSNFIPKCSVFELLQVLIKDKLDLNDSKLQNLDRIQLMALISLEKYEFLNKQFEVKFMQVPYVDALIVIQDFHSMSKHDSLNQSSSELPIKAIVDGMYKGNSGTLEWYVFMQKIQSQMDGLSDYIKRYFMEKFMNRPMNNLPQLSHPSYILNQDIVYQLKIHSFKTKLYTANHLQLIYSSILHSGGFSQLVQQMIDSQLPTIILVQHEDYYKTLQNNSSIISKPYVFGALSNCRWFDSAQACGDSDDIIFSIYPKFSIFRRKSDKAEKNYCFLNYQCNQKLPQGIGFGGTKEGKNCRIWIDQNFEMQSYSNNKDETYQSGEMVSSNVQFLRVSLIEVWAIKHTTFSVDNMNSFELQSENEIYSSKPSNLLKKEFNKLQINLKYLINYIFIHYYYNSKSENRKTQLTKNRQTLYENEGKQQMDNYGYSESKSTKTKTVQDILQSHQIRLKTQT